MDVLEELKLEAGEHGVAHEESIRDLFARAAVEIERLRLAKLPTWAQAALTSSTADITVTGKTFSDQEMRDWLATIPEPIEPAQ